MKVVLKTVQKLKSVFLPKFVWRSVRGCGDSGPRAGDSGLEVTYSGDSSLGSKTPVRGVLDVKNSSGSRFWAEKLDPNHQIRGVNDGIRLEKVGD